MDCLYLDHNATTPLLPAVADAMRPYLDSFAGNASSAHRQGRRARQALEDAREWIAALLGAHADEVVFTSGATEANNLAIFGLAGEPPGHLVASPIEHPSVAEPLRHLAAKGFEVAHLPVSREGVVEIEALEDLVRPDTRLVALMLVNHETGAIQPAASAKRQAGEAVHLHCDATQGAGKLPTDFHALGAATLALSAHKLHGPPGIGALLVRRGVALRPLLHGGHQQRGRRPGTEPVALAVGFVAALDLACREREARHAHLTRLRQELLDHLRAHAAPVVVNGPANALPTTLNVSFPGLAAEVLLMALDLAGVACSTGSACSSGSLLPSPTLRAMGVPDDVLRSAMRFSFGATTTPEDVREASRRISNTVNRLRHA
jgi:cysteine desulfurase